MTHARAATAHYETLAAALNEAMADATVIDLTEPAHDRYLALVLAEAS